MKTLTYHEQEEKNNTIRLRELIADLPPYVSTFFRGIEPVTAPRTRIAYAFDLHVFFEFIAATNPSYQGKPLKEIDFDLLTRLQPLDIEEYLEYLKLYTNKEGKEITNKERGIKRKLCALRSFYKYFHQNRLISENPTLQVNMPKIHEKNIIRFEPNEAAEFLDHVETGEKLTHQQQLRHDSSKIRDLAITTLMLGTGIRVSECVGIDFKDIDFETDKLNIVRKGGYESYVYFGEEVKEALMDYYSIRKNQVAKEGHENAFFLSNRLQRISVRNVEILVKKYAQTVTTLKKITPHKLRSTYGTELYKETGDIYLVADVLGHKDVNTTRKHYADMEEQRRKSAKDAVTLREKKKESDT